MEWLDIAGKRQVTAACLSRADWAAVVAAQPTYDLAGVAFLDAALYGETAPEPQQEPDPTYAPRLAAAQLLATGASWYEAAVWCNALSAELGLAAAYLLNNSPAKWVPAIIEVRSKRTQAELDLAPGTKGVRLLVDAERQAAARVAGFTAIQGIHEWGGDRRRAPFIFESAVFSGSNSPLCNGMFKLPWNAFRVVRG